MIFRSGCAAQMSSSVLNLLAGLTNEANEGCLRVRQAPWCLLNKFSRDLDPFKEVLNVLKDRDNFISGPQVRNKKTCSISWLQI